MYSRQESPLLINDTPFDLPSGEFITLDDSLIVREEDLYTLVSPNNDVVRVRQFDSRVDVTVSLAENRQGNVVGLLGNGNDDPSDDIALVDGTIIDTRPLPFTELYEQFGSREQGWRISQEESLFSYAPGEDTTTFTNLDFPSRRFTIDDLDPEQRANAEQAVREAGITDPDLLADTILDFALTGEENYIKGSLAQQQFRATLANPNIVETNGVDAQGWIAPNQSLSYTVNFANENPETTVGQVTISQPLDPNLDPDTLQLEEFGLGEITREIPNGLQNYRDRVNLEDTENLLVEINATLDSNNTITWTLTALDPATEEPIANDNQGLLPANTEGFVRYTIQPQADLDSETALSAIAEVTFNDTEAETTLPFLNTLDSTPPSSSIEPLQETLSSEFTLAWDGNDEGSGIANYDIYVAEGNEPFQLLLDDTTETSTAFTGEPGVTYRFYSIATDQVGNIQDHPEMAQASTTVASVPPKLIFGNLEDNNFDAEFSESLLDGNNYLIFTGAGNDLVDNSTVESNSNRIYGGSDDDEILAQNNDRLFGNRGDDILNASEGSGNNRLYGNQGNDDLFAGNEDRLAGGQGDDRLFVTTGGNNILMGNSGADQFWIATAELPETPNTIIDFVSGEDILGIGGFPDLAFNELSLTPEGTDTLIGFDANQPFARLIGIQADTLAPADFIFDSPDTAESFF